MKNMSLIGKDYKHIAINMFPLNPNKHLNMLLTCCYQFKNLTKVTAVLFTRQSLLNMKYSFKVNSYQETEERKSNSKRLFENTVSY